MRTNGLGHTAVKTLQTILSLLFVLASFFVPAGRLDWLEAWAFLALYVLVVLALFAWLRHHDPALFAERRRRRSGNQEPWDKVILGCYSAFLWSQIVISGLDAGRFHWSDVPVAWRVAGWAGLVGCMGIVWWVTATNTFASGVARIQEERGQAVVDSGPYAIVRHPMYAAILVFIPSLALVLRSLWALVPAAVTMVLFVLRTVLEDRMLRAKLPGYAEYAGRVRYRLVPGVW